VKKSQTEAKTKNLILEKLKAGESFMDILNLGLTKALLSIYELDKEDAIHASGSAESDPTIPPTDPNDDGILSGDDDFSINSSTLEEFKRQQQESAKLRADLISARAHISQQMTQLNETSVNRLNQTQTLIAENTKLNEEAAKARWSQEQLQNTLDVTLKKHSDAIHQLQRMDPPGLSSSIRDLLNVYHELDDDSKKALLSSTISTNNTQLQRAILDLW
jgi:hypothetical protein